MAIFNKGGHRVFVHRVNAKLFVSPAPPQNWERYVFPFWEHDVKLILQFLANMFLIWEVRPPRGMPIPSLKYSPPKIIFCLIGAFDFASQFLSELQGFRKQLLWFCTCLYKKN
jgi:hypothetical protein